MANIQSINYDKNSKKYVVTLDQPTAGTEIFTTSLTGSKFWQFTNSVLLGSGLTPTLIVPKDITSFVINTQVEPANYYVKIGNVEANDIATSNLISSITFADDIFTVNLQNSLGVDTAFLYSIASDPYGVQVYSTSDNSDTDQITGGLNPPALALGANAIGSSKNIVRVSEGQSSFDVKILYPLINLDRDITLTIAGVSNTTTVTTLISANIQATKTIENAGSGDTESVAVAFDYSEHMNALISAIDRLSKNTSNTALILSSLLSQVKSQTTAIENILLSDGIPIKDVYSAVSYASLIRVLEEDGVDIDALIAKTQNRLDRL